MPTDSELYNFSIRSNKMGFWGRFYRSSYFFNVIFFSSWISMKRSVGSLTGAGLFAIFLNAFEEFEEDE